MRFAWVFCLFLFVSKVSAQPLTETGAWYGNLYRADGQVIRFHFDLVKESSKTVLYLVNASERIRVEKVRITKDSVWIDMPVFESAFRAKRISAARWEGQWIREGAQGFSGMPFAAFIQKSVPAKTIKKPLTDITGRWSVRFLKPGNISRPAIAEWQQKGHTLHGTFLTPSGDYRYLSGVVDGDSMRLGTFDGAHAYLFTAHIKSDKEVDGGMYYSGAAATESWTAIKNDTATLPELALMYLKEGEERLNFRFRDIDGKPVSINDARFKNKVVVVQLMGSWCPNCMDETAFLSGYYRKNHQRGIEIIGLAYEYSADRKHADNSIRKFKDRFKVPYPLLNTGVTVSDSLRTEKTLPQLTPIKSFPSTIFIGKDGRVARIKAGFEGPGTGIHYEEMKQDFENTVSRLLKQH